MRKTDEYHGKKNTAENKIYTESEQKPTSTKLSQEVLLRQPHRVAHSFSLNLHTQSLYR